MKMKKVFLEILIILVVAVAIFFALRTTVQAYDVIGSSMEPNLHYGDRLMVNKVVYNIHDPERGDVIILKPPHLPEDAVPYVKRIIALPGDTVEVKDGAVYVNGIRLDEPYLDELPEYTFPELTVPEGEYFVLGDNRNHSVDSHNGWTVPEDNIIGKAWFSYWPSEEWGFVDHYALDEQLDGSTDE